MRKKDKLVCGVGVNDLKTEVYNENKECYPFYGIWQSIIQRCYDHKFQEKHPNYKGCKIAVQWLKLSNFKKWYEDNCIKDCVLDKNLLSNDNGKTYCATSCCFVPLEICRFTARKTPKKYLNGVTKHKESKRYISRIYYDGKMQQLGYYDTEIEAHNVYLKAKAAHASELADKYKDVISERAYIALKNYKEE